MVFSQNFKPKFDQSMYLPFMLTAKSFNSFDSFKPQRVAQSGFTFDLFKGFSLYNLNSSVDFVVVMFICQ
jgi:hypothetical protein